MISKNQHKTPNITKIQLQAKWKVYRNLGLITDIQVHIIHNIQGDKDQK